MPQRKDLPWQTNKTAYRVWISEIMLQQTQVKTALPFFERFINQFENVGDLAKAPIDEVLHFWSGLGYYARARNLHKTAKIVTTKYGGSFPKKVKDLESLPGIGKSTAGAIIALSRGEKATILDGNVKRVLSRLFGLTAWPGLKKQESALWELAQKFTPDSRISDYTQPLWISVLQCVPALSQIAFIALSNTTVKHSPKILWKNVRGANQNKNYP